MKKNLLKILSLSLFVFSASAFSAEADLKKVNLVEWNTAQSEKRFARAIKTDFFPLVNQFEAQENRFYCGPASSVIVLNALRRGKESVKKPTDPMLFRGSKEFLPKDFNPVYERYTQDAFFAPGTEKIKSVAQVFGQPIDGKNDYGLQLHQLAELLKAHNLKVEMRLVNDDAKSKDIKKEIIKNLRTSGDYVIVNYARKSLGQNGPGHISPLGAYDVRSDSVLILDVTAASYPWVWVRLDDLIAAMRTKDTIQNRGYLLVSEAL